MSNTATIIENNATEAEILPAEAKSTEIATQPPQRSEIATVQQSSADAIMGVISALSNNQAVDVEKIEKLMNIYTKEIERQEAKVKEAAAAEALRLFNIDFIAMKPHLPLVIRTKNNDHTKSKYAPLEEVNKTIDPILEKYGFGTSAIVIGQTELDVTMELSVIHKAGHSMTMRLTMPIDDKGPGGTKNKTTGQGIASTMTSMKRVGFCAMLNISTGDDKDLNGSKANTALSYITTEQAVQIDLDLQTAGIDRKSFFEWAKTYNEDGEPVQDARFILAKNLKSVQVAINDRKKESSKAKKAGA